MELNRKADWPWVFCELSWGPSHWCLIKAEDKFFPCLCYLSFSDHAVLEAKLFKTKIRKTLASNMFKFVRTIYITNFFCNNLHFFLRICFFNQRDEPECLQKNYVICKRQLLKRTLQRKSNGRKTSVYSKHFAQGKKPNVSESLNCMKVVSWMVVKENKVNVNKLESWMTAMTDKHYLKLPAWEGLSFEKCLVYFVSMLVLL